MEIIERTIASVIQNILNEKFYNRVCDLGIYNTFTEYNLFKCAFI